MKNKDWIKKINKIIREKEYFKRNVFFDFGTRKEIYLMFGETTSNKDSLRELVWKKGRKNSPNKFYLAEDLHSKILSKDHFDLLRQEEIMLAISTNTSIDIVNLSYGSISEMGSMAFAPASRNKVLIGYSKSTLDKKKYIYRGPLKLIPYNNKKDFSLKDWNIELQSGPNWTHRLIYKPDNTSVQNYMNWIKSQNRNIPQKVKKIWKINKTKHGIIISVPGAMFLLFEYITHQKKLNCEKLVENFFNIIKESTINSIAYVNFYHTTDEMLDDEKANTKNLIRFLIRLMLKFKVLKYNYSKREITLGSESFTFYKNPHISLRLSNFDPEFLKKKTDLVTFLNETFQLKFLELINIKKGKKSINYFKWSQQYHSNNKYWNSNKKTKNKKIWSISLAHKNVQKAINHYFWKHTNLRNNISKNSFAYQNKKNVVQYAKLHINKKSIIKLDISKFFPSIKDLKVKEVLHKSYNFNKDEIKLIKIICFLENGTLPIGWSTSPALSELVFAQIDEEIESNIPKNAIWSRYADDITISFDQEKTLSYLIGISKTIKKILLKHKFEMNEQKTRYYITKQNLIYAYDEKCNKSKVETVKITGLTIQSIYKPELGFPRCSNRQYKKLTKLYYEFGKESQKFIGLSKWLDYVNNKQYMEWKNIFSKE